MRFTLNIYKKTGYDLDYATKRIDMTLDEAPTVSKLLKEAVVQLLLNQQFDGLFEADLYDCATHTYHSKLLIFLIGGKLTAVYKIIDKNDDRVILEECPCYMGV